MNIADIPVQNLQRAATFYKALFKKEMKLSFSKNNKNIAILQSKLEDDFSIRLIQEEGFIPNMFGPLIYFQSEENINNKLKTINKIGGKIINEPKEQNHKLESNKQPYRAEVHDSEGNRIAIFMK